MKSNSTFTLLTHLAVIFLLIFFILGLSGCATDKTVKKNEYEPPKIESTRDEKSYNGAIYRAGMSVDLFEDATAKRVGDIITVKLVESASALASSDTKADKKQKVEMPPPTVAGSDVSKDQKNVLENNIEAKRDFRGGGESNQAHNFQAVIAVSVVEVLPNRYLVVRGEKLITLNQSEEYIRFSGIVRPQDLTLDNSVESQKVANVNISYAGSGVLSSANSMGTLARFFQNPVYPY